jgi:hypothetical protein
MILFTQIVIAQELGPEQILKSNIYKVTPVDIFMGAFILYYWSSKSN